MKLNFLKSESHSGGFQRAIVGIAILLTVGSSIPSTRAQLASRKRITSLQSSQTASGTRVSVFSDSSLSDYEAFRRGDRFYIKVPLASFEAPQPNVHGDGFEDVQVQRVGDSIVVSFRLQHGISARVDQRSNRLDVYFTSQNNIARTPPPNTQTSRTNTGVPGIVTLDTARNQQAQRNPNAAGPKPPDTSGGNRPRIVTQQPVAYRQESEPTSQRSQSHLNWGREPSSRAISRNGGTPSATRSEPPLQAGLDREQSVSNTSPTPTTSSTPAYSSNQASTSATPYSPYSTRPVVTSSSANSSSGWVKRLEQAKQWVSMNRMVAAIGAGSLLGLILLVVTLLYRRRRKPAPAKHKKLPGVQPKYSPASEQDDFQNKLGDENYETVFDDYAVEANGSQPSTQVPLADDSELTGSLQWAGLFEDVEATEMPAEEAATSSYVPATPTVPVHAMKHEEYEREVFEL